MLAIPAAGGQTGTGKTAAASAKKRQSATQQKQPTSAPAMKTGIDSLFDEAGLAEAKGPRCPACSAAVPKGAAICVSCGLDLRSGEKLSGYKGNFENLEFENMHLSAASASMKRESEMQQRTLNAGMPWWVMLSLLIVGILFAASGVIIVDKAVGRPQPQGTFLGNIQRLPMEVVVLGVFLIGSALISFFAHWALVAAAFKDTLKFGLMALLIPLFSGVYGILRFRDIRGTALSFWISMMLGSILLIYLQVKYSIIG